MAGEVARLCDLGRHAVKLAGGGRRELVHLDGRVAQEGVEQSALTVELERDDPLALWRRAQRAEERRDDALGQAAARDVVERAPLGEPALLRLVHELVQCSVAADAARRERVGRRREEDAARGGAADRRERDAVGRDREAREEEGDLLLGAGFGRRVAEADEGDGGRGSEDEDVGDRVDKDAWSRAHEGDADDDVAQLLEGREGRAVCVRARLVSRGRTRSGPGRRGDGPVCPVPQEQAVVDADPCAVNLGQQSHRAARLGDCRRKEKVSERGQQGKRERERDSRSCCSKRRSGKRTVRVFVTGCHAWLGGRT